MYLTLWETGYRDACMKKDAAGCAGAEEILYELVRAAEHGGKLGLSRSTRLMLIDPSFHLDGTALGLRALLDHARFLHGVTQYAGAADLFERFAEKAPQHADAPDALYNAIAIRLALGEDETADVERFEKTYGEKRAADLARIKIAQAKALASRAEHAKVAKVVTDPVRRLVAKHVADELPALDLLVARSLAARKKAADARKIFVRVAATRLTFGGSDDATMRGLGRGLVAVGEARVALADEAFTEALRIAVKKSDRASLARKREAIERAEKLYLKVTEIEPMPPPGPTVTAAARVARMKGQLWAQAHLAFGDAESTPLLRDARAANLQCVSLGVKLQVAESAPCTAWLSRHFPREFPDLAEIAPKVTAGGALVAPRPLDREGEELSPDTGG